MCVYLFVCKRNASVFSRQYAWPFVPSLPLFSVFYPPTAAFPRGNLIFCLTLIFLLSFYIVLTIRIFLVFWMTAGKDKLLSLIVFQSTALTDVRSIMVGFRLKLFLNLGSRSNLILPAIIPPLLCLCICCSPLHHPFCSIPASLTNILHSILVMMNEEPVTVNLTSHPSQTLQQHN